MHDLVATKGGMMFCTAALISPACRGHCDGYVWRRSLNAITKINCSEKSFSFAPMLQAAQSIKQDK